jgi:hypothetical protein
MTAMRVTPAFDILTNLGAPLRVFCHFVPSHVLTEGFSAKMAISEKLMDGLFNVINEL